MPDEPKRTRIAFDPSAQEYADLSAAAEAAGIPVNTLARALFHWVFPLFESEGFSVAALKQHYGEGAELVARLDPNVSRRPRSAKPKAG